jgi:polysaccharide biosynthesis/export protein
MALCPSIRRLALVLLAAAGLAGCHAVDFYTPTLQQPVPSEMEPARELSMVSLQAYQVEPPDILMIELLRLVPLPPYRIETYDVLQVRAVGVLPMPNDIDGFFLVEGEGVVTLGPAYGRVRVAGMTVEQANEAILRRLRELFVKPEVSVQLAKTAGTAPVTGEYLVGPDGTINLRQYGTLHVAGKSVTQIRQQLNKHLSRYFDSPDAAVEVRQFNSKVFYVITEGAGIGDNIRRVPVTGNDTVLDALSAVNGLSQISSTKVWIARPAPGSFGCEQILPVDYDAITHGGSTATNYQVMPGDRVFVAGDSMIAANNWLTKMTAPIERIFGVISLTTSTARSWQTLGREYNRQRN